MKKTIKPRVMLIFSIVILITVVIVLVLSEDTIEVKQSAQELPKQLVTIEQVIATSANPKIKVFSEVKPRWQAVLTASVGGEITRVYDNALAGEKVDKDELLLEIESSAYIAELRAAELALKEAQFELRKAKNATLVAKKLFNSKGTKPPNELTIHLPQLRIAESSVVSAQARVDATKQRLSNTKVTAPFSGIVTERWGNVGQRVSAGERLLNLVDNKTFELKVKVNHHQWKLLKQPLANQVAQVFLQTGEQIGTARVRIGSDILDEATRQYIIYLDVENKVADDILVGAFVQVVFTGITKNNTLNIPASAVTQSGNVWLVDKENRLQKFEADILYRDNGRVIIQAPSSALNWQVAVTPLASFLPDQLVDIQQIGAD